MGTATRVRIGKMKGPYGFFSYISSAFFEWLLIIILFFNALSSYLAAKFARYCKLRNPCFLCSRLDDSFRELLCETHKSEISSLAFCSSHGMLGDARTMCDDCLISFVCSTECDDGLNGDFLQEKFLGEEMISVPLLNKEATSLFPRHCTCCSLPFRSRPHTHTFVQRQEPSRVDIVEPTFASTGSLLLDGTTKAMENDPSMALMVDHIGDHGFDWPSHVGYSEAKITSDSESEVPFLDCNDATTQAHNYQKDEFLSRGPQPARMTIFRKNKTRVVSDDMVIEKLIYPSPLIPEASLVTSERKVNGSQVENPLNSSDITAEQLPPEGLNTKLYAPEVEFANGGATKAFGSTDVSYKTSPLMKGKYNPGIRPLFASSSSSDLITERESSSPRVIGDEPRLSDASNSSGVLNYVKRYYIDRYESGLESLDGSIISDAEGEGAIERLKRQIEMDRKSMSILYKELEEERNASDIAAQEAMAMINRLQQEKAALHMEALQYLRMMEEQTEYDQDALQKLTDLLVDRDKELQDLEAEVDSYRKQFGGEPLGDCEEREYREYTPVSTPRFVRSTGREIGSNIVNSSAGDFEDEKVYISECLQRLEKRLQLLLSNSRLRAGDSAHVVEICDDIPDKCSLLEETETRNDEHVDKEDLKFCSRRNDIIAIGNEISQLCTRLEAFEADKFC